MQFQEFYPCSLESHSVLRAVPELIGRIFWSVWPFYYFDLLPMFHTCFTFVFRFWLVPALKHWSIKVYYYNQVKNVHQIIGTNGRLQQLLNRLSYWGRFSPDSLMTALSKALPWPPWFRFLTLSHLTLSCPSNERTWPSPAHAQSCVSGWQAAGISCQHSKSNTMGKENLCPKALAGNFKGKAEEWISQNSFSSVWIWAGRDAWCFPWLKDALSC